MQDQNVFCKELIKDVLLHIYMQDFIWKAISPQAESVKKAQHGHVDPGVESLHGSQSSKPPNLNFNCCSNHNNKHTRKRPNQDYKNDIYNYSLDLITTK